MVNVALFVYAIVVLECVWYSTINSSSDTVWKHHLRLINSDKSITVCIELNMFQKSQPEATTFPPFS